MKKIFNKKVYIFILILIFLFQNSEVLAFNDYGDYSFKNEDNYIIKEINTLADVKKDGSMFIRQKWVFNDRDIDATEHYIVFNKDSLNGAKLENFMVSQNGHPLKEVDWDIDKSFNEKKGKFGINETSDNIELCFGIGEKKKDNIFEITYIVRNIMEKTTDGGVFLHWKFINDNLSDPVGKVRLEIYFPAKIKKIFGFGYRGIVAMSSKDKNVVIYENGEDNPLREDDKLIALVEVEDDFESYRNREESRLDLYEKAFENSSYSIEDLDNEGKPIEEKDLLNSIKNGEEYNVNEFEDGFLINFFIIILLIVFSFIILIIYFTRPKLKVLLKTRDKKEAYFMTKPNTDPNKLMFLLVQEGLTYFQNIILYYFVKWINYGLVTIEEEKKDKYSYYFLRSNVRMDYPEKIFYDFFINQGEFKKKDKIKISYDKFKKIDYGKLQKAFNEYMKSDEAYNRLSEFIEKDGKRDILNSRGEKELLQYYGVRNYLKDFTKRKEEELKDIKLESNHLELAVLLGLAKRVEKQIKLYPDVYSIENNFYNYYMPYYILHSVNNSVSSAINYAGYSSYGGGGGFSGGGSGGGSR